jgi:hypothetical protein
LLLECKDAFWPLQQEEENIRNCFSTTEVDYYLSLYTVAPNSYPSLFPPLLLEEQFPDWKHLILEAYLK